MATPPIPVRCGSLSQAAEVLSTAFIFTNICQIYSEKIIALAAVKTFDIKKLEPRKHVAREVSS
jgi:hypothetical protein